MLLNYVVFFKQKPAYEMRISDWSSDVCSSDLTPEPIDTDPAIVAELIEQTEASVAAAEQRLSTATGEELLELLLADITDMRQVLMDPRSMQVVTAAFEAAWWLDERLGEGLFEPSATDTLNLSAPGTVTSEMGLALLDVADAIRPHPEVVAYLPTVDAADFLA